MVLKGESRVSGPDNKIQNHLAIKYKHAVSTVGKGSERGHKGRETSGEGPWGSNPALLCTPSPPLPSVSVGACVCVGLCAHFPRPLPAPNPPPPPLIGAIPVAAGCHSAVTPLPIVFRGGKEGELEGEKPQPALPLPSPAASTRSPGGGKSRGHSIL